MQSLFILYSTLAVFGIGVTIIDLFGVLDQASAGGSDDAGDTAGDAAGDATGADADGDAAFVDTDGGTSPELAEDGNGTAVRYGDHGSWVVSGRTGTGLETGPGTRSASSTGAHQGTLVLARIIGTLRTGVYFSLGAGPTGLFALLTGVGGTASLAWSAGAGVFIAVISRALRALVRRDLDSSIKPEEFLMDLGIITVSVAPGTMGKAVVSRYGRDTELYVRCKDQSRTLPKGEAVRIVDMDEDCYWVEAQN